ncbi:MAG: carotenoid oxygenase family protein [Acidimicrobiales bacterium]
MSAVDLNAGVIAPVADEVHLDTGITVEGRIPDELNGVLVRNGPNPYEGRFSGATMLDWWTGPGMVHGLSIGDGTVGWYRNRWTIPRPDRDDQVGVAPANVNVNVIEFGGRILALGEGARPLELDGDLETIGPMTFDQALPNGMMAHPKIDRRTGELRFFRADWGPPYLVVGSLDAHLRLTSLREVALDRPVMMHDFAITERFDVVLDTNVILDPSLLDLGIPLPLRWDEDHRTRIGLIPRDGADPRWCEISPCFIQHVVNAYETADRVVLDAVRYPTFLRFDDDIGEHRPNPLGSLWRFEIDPLRGVVTESQLDDRKIELPRIDERFTGTRNRAAFVVEQPTDTEMRGLRRYDLDTGESQLFPIEQGDQNSEAVFAPRGPNEGQGWLLFCVYRAATDSTDVVIADAEDLSGPAQAVVHLPRRIPAGFHGAWIPTG